MVWTGGGGAGFPGRVFARGLPSSDSSAWALLSRCRSSSTAARRSASPWHCSSRNAARRAGSRSIAWSNNSSTRWGEGFAIGVPRAGVPASPESLQQPGPDVAPLPVQGARRQAEDFRRLIRRQPAEVAQQHDLRLRGVLFLQLFQGLVDGEDVLRGRLDDGTGLVQLLAPPPAAPHGAGLAPRLLDEDVAHGAGGGEEEVLPRLPGDVALVGQAQVGLVDQGRRLQRLAGRQLGHAGAGQLVQLLVHDGHQVFRRGRVAGLSRLQQLRDGLDRLGRHETRNPQKKLGPFSRNSRLKKWGQQGQSGLPTGPFKVRVSGVWGSAGCWACVRACGRAGPACWRKPSRSGGDGASSQRRQYDSAGSSPAAWSTVAGPGCKGSSIADPP